MRTHFGALVAAALALLTVALPAAAAPDPLTSARDGTAAFNEQASAQAAGYDLLTDAEGIACIDQPGAGAMGVHYVKGALVQSGTIDAARPQALVYEVQPSGRLQLVALEYVVLQGAWDSTHNAPPTLFGQKFMVSPDGNRFGLPAFYSLHAWIWKHNPSGQFSAYNPNVSCGAPERLDASSNMDESMHGTNKATDAAQFTCSIPADETPVAVVPEVGLTL